MMDFFYWVAGIVAVLYFLVIFLENYTEKKAIRDASEKQRLLEAHLRSVNERFLREWRAK